jgi:hypothetical protein
VTSMRWLERLHTQTIGLSETFVAMAATREERLQELCSAGCRDEVVGLLISSTDVRIAVPCAVLSKGASGAGSKVVVKVLRKSHGSEVALDCGRWWKGAPQSAVDIDYRQVRGGLALGGKRWLPPCIARHHLPCTRPLGFNRS